MTIRTLTLAAALSAGMAGSALAATNWTGFYLGVQGGYADQSATQLEVDDPELTVGEENDFPTNGGVAGAHAGYNHQMGDWVVGVEADLEYSDISGFHNFGGGDDFVSEDFDWLGSLRVRAGYSDGVVLIYATGGLALGGVSMYVNEGLPTTDFLSGDDTPWGYTIGGGAEFAFSDRWSGRIEYRWTDLDDTSVAGNIFADDYIYPFDNEFSTVRIGVSYHLN